METATAPADFELLDQRKDCTDFPYAWCTAFPYGEVYGFPVHLYGFSIRVYGFSVPIFDLSLNPVLRSRRACGVINSLERTRSACVALSAQRARKPQPTVDNPSCTLFGLERFPKPGNAPTPVTQRQNNQTGESNRRRKDT